MKRLIIAGTRSFSEERLLIREVDAFRKRNNLTKCEIVSGNAPGADELGERYAKKNSLPLRIFKADWENNGKAAGPIRNKEMAEYATHCIIFWDGKSKGTQSMMNLAAGNGLILKVIQY